MRIVKKKKEYLIHVPPIILFHPDLLHTVYSLKNNKISQSHTARKSLFSTKVLHLEENAVLKELLVVAL